MHTQFLGKPCRNFQILGAERFVDPRDGREKAVLSNFAAGSVGTLIFIDPESGAGESLGLPGDSGAWAVMNYRDERLFIGTCGAYGYLHDLDLGTRTFAPPLRDPAETYIWNLCTGSDGLIYGGTYGGCVLLRFDPAARTLENLGRVSDCPGNLYSRMVYGDIPGHILISGGTADAHLALWSMDSGKAVRFGEPGDTVGEMGPGFFSVQRGGKPVFYDSHTLEQLSADPRERLTPAPEHRFPGTRLSVALQDGRDLCVRGQSYYLDDHTPTQPELLPIPAPAPATHMLTIAADTSGRIWGASGFGQTLCRWDPTTGEDWNSQTVTFNSGEVYGVAPVGERLFLACYSGGDHVVYDTGRPWNQLDDINPKTLESVAPELVRPAGKSVVGPDGNVWTGWMARYGTYGGGLSRVDVDTLGVTCWYDPIPEQAVSCLTADDRFLYFITSGSANGLSAKVEPFHFVVWSPAGHIVWQRQFADGEVLTTVAAGCGHVVVAVDSRLEIYAPEQQRFARTIQLETPCHYLAALWPDRLAAFCGENLVLVDPASGTAAQEGLLPGRVSTATTAPDGQVYCAVGTELHRIVR